MNSVPELDKLFYYIGTYRRSDEYKKLIELIRKFPRVAPYNVMLIHIQKPGSQYVASVNEWKSRFHRTIKPGARPLVILRPFGPVAFLFEYLDTDGPTLPEELINPFKVEGNISKDKFMRLVNNLKCDGISYNEVDLGVTSAGFAQTTQNGRDQTITMGKKIFQVKTLFDLVVNRENPVEIKFTSVIHELAHIYCGHLGSPHPKWWEDRHKLDQNTGEFEAESICWLICERLGIKNPSAQYLNGYLDENGEIPPISIETVLKATGSIESMIHNSKTPRKEIIISVSDIK
ncbi:MAG TPA: hypothetical protein VLH15_05755 [Dehalococcoidales bacterium]|nr:hypothetical protein [Dehalococcoidales bacterium]